MNRGNFSSRVPGMDPEWITIREATEIAHNIKKTRITDSDIYRHALYGDITLSIYFQSPVILRKVRVSEYKVTLRPVQNSLIHRLCFLDQSSFIRHSGLIVSNCGKYTFPTNRIIDTPLSGHESLLIQHLLARSLSLPLPEENDVNHGISVIIAGEIFQLFEKTTWRERINKQIMRLPEHIAPDIYAHPSYKKMRRCSHHTFFPLHYLPADASFVIRCRELEKLMRPDGGENISQESPPRTRISTPLSRLFWLSCRRNDTISPLINQPYKLLSIFEQWASEEGITDRLSADTLKSALERGSPGKTNTHK
ncbi:MULTISPECIES: hypothetical protein [Enterobacteriaceae]|uniref:hypothetical protein n=1 Tax=Enterobacteriaceae TaxID=543 RepID=UPI00032EA6DF|nr:MULTISPECIES: hypothetical protein [Klebsiella]AID91722.1 hypothetical protein KONIH1_22320 [Klebsiella oxytoca KONIH1]AUV90856.1 hypothetical protein C2U44_07080 [Klebsiella oxytoca]EJG2383876.1 hypothetical protein [Raoultella ornithinolytica]EKU4735593.1 hypothetical protein [Kluyvera ascorbata]ELI8048689.1 hypothetical protein [Yersinia enterocolitica]EOQ28314.1 hypothetical protein WEU_03231 [Citrobacter sp. KTE32]